MDARWDDARKMFRGGTGTGAGSAVPPAPPAWGQVQV